MSNQDNTVPAVLVQFTWDICRPDNRQYKQQSTELSVYINKQPAIIDVYVPLDERYVSNYQEYLAKLKGEGDAKETARLTPDGYAYAMSQLENVVSDPIEVKDSIPWSESDKTESWGEETESDDWSEPEEEKEPEDWAFSDDTSTDDDTPWDEDEEEWE